MKHPISRTSLERFAAGTASREEKRVILAHLLKGCATCAAALRELDCRDRRDCREQPVDAYDKALDRIERARAALTRPGSRIGALAPARR
jgi:hypothetical protein